MKVTVTIGAEEQKFEGGTSAANWRIEAVDSFSTIAFDYEGPDPTTVFDMPEGNTYTLRGWRLASDHTMLGTAAQLVFTVGSDLAVILVASDITAQSSPNGVASR
jgi:hypothetical protein